MKTANPVSCSVLTGAGELATGPAKFKWTPKTKPSATTGTLGVLLTEESSVALTGQLTAGPYSSTALSGTTTATFTGGAACGAKKAVKEGPFTGAPVAFE